MVRQASFDSSGRKTGAWSPDEDTRLRAHVQKYGPRKWSSVPIFAGLKRCGKSCRLRWVNYLKPGLRHGNFTECEENLIIELHAQLGNKWSAIAAMLHGRTDHEIKNHWNGHLKKRDTPKNSRGTAASKKSPIVTTSAIVTSLEDDHPQNESSFICAQNPENPQNEPPHFNSSNLGGLIVDTSLMDSQGSTFSHGEAILGNIIPSDLLPEEQVSFFAENPENLDATGDIFWPDESCFNQQLNLDMLPLSYEEPYYDSGLFRDRLTILDNESTTWFAYSMENSSWITSPVEVRESFILSADTNYSSGIIAAADHEEFYQIGGCSQIFDMLDNMEVGESFTFGSFEEDYIMHPTV